MVYCPSKTDKEMTRMITQKIVILSALVFIVVVAAGLALWHKDAAAQGPDRGERRPEGRDRQPRFPMQENHAVCASGDYVYVVSGNTIYQFSAVDLKIVNKAQIETESRFHPDDRPDKMENPFPPSRKTSEDEGNR